MVTVIARSNLETNALLLYLGKALYGYNPCLLPVLVVEIHYAGFVGNFEWVWTYAVLV